MSEEQRTQAQLEREIRDRKMIGRSQRERIVKLERDLQLERQRGRDAAAHAWRERDRA